MLDLETIGYYLWMEGQEQKEEADDEENEEEED